MWDGQAESSSSSFPTHGSVDWHLEISLCKIFTLSSKYQLTTLYKDKIQPLIDDLGSQSGWGGFVITGGGERARHQECDTRETLAGWLLGEDQQKMHRISSTIFILLLLIEVHVKSPGTMDNLPNQKYLIIGLPGFRGLLQLEFKLTLYTSNDSRDYSHILNLSHG